MLGTDHEPGIYVRTLNDLFRAIEETSDDMEYEVSMSYLEVSPPPELGLDANPMGRSLDHPSGARSLGSFLGASSLQLPRAYRRPHFINT